MSKNPEDAFTVEACVDCYELVCGGPPENPDADWSVEKASKGLEGADVTPGHLSEREHPGEECDEDSECASTTFSKSPCGICGSPLHGAREDVTFWPLAATS